MFRIALQSLLHDRAKLIAALAGVAFAATLALVQNALYEGFLYTSSAMISRMGGDVWVMAKGTEVLDSVEVLSAGTRSIVQTHPCVTRVRPLVFTWSFIRKAGKTRDTVRVVGVDPAQLPLVPWAMSRGLPHDMDAPMRIAVDEFDMEKLQIQGEPVGAELNIMGQTVHVAAVTSGVRSFTLLPFVFTNISDARKLTGLSDGEVNYWVLDISAPSCASQVISHIEQNPQLHAETRDSFIKRSQDYWILGSGVGAVLAFSALLGLIVGGVIVGQTLYSLTTDYQNELATLKAIGATGGELIGFVAWQAAFLVVGGCILGAAGSVAIGLAARGAGLSMIFSPNVFVSGILVIVVTCLFASLMSVRRVLKLDASEVFQ